MSGLEDAARDARAAADTSIDPAVHAVANALEAALAAEVARGHEPADTTGIPTPEQAGYVTEMTLPRGDAPDPPGSPGWWTG
jgi:hypothetical protein